MGDAFVFERRCTDIYLFDCSYVGSLPLKLVYDLDVMNQNHPLITRVEKAVAMLACVLYPGARLVNSFPLCESFTILVDHCFLPYSLSRCELC